MYISSERLSRDANKLSNYIKMYERSSKKRYDWIIIIARGWFHLWYYLAVQLWIRDIHTLSLESPHSGRTTEILVHTNPITNLDSGKKYLVIDDLIDTGKTLDKVEQMLWRYINYDIAVLYEKKDHPFKTERIIHSVDKSITERVDFYYE